MSEFKRLSDRVLAAGQIEPGDVAQAKDAGVTLIVNNRPDGEDSDQPTGEAIRAAAEGAGLAYRAIPIGPAGFGHADVEIMAEALKTADGTVLSYCRTGTRSTLLWALAQAKAGHDVADIARAAADAGYDVAPVRAAMESLAAKPAT